MYPYRSIAFPGCSSFPGFLSNSTLLSLTSKHATTTHFFAYAVNLYSPVNFSAFSVCRRNRSGVSDSPAQSPANIDPDTAYAATLTLLLAASVAVIMPLMGTTNRMDDSLLSRALPRKMSNYFDISSLICHSSTSRTFFRHFYIILRTCSMIFVFAIFSVPFHSCCMNHMCMLPTSHLYSYLYSYLYEVHQVHTLPPFHSSCSMSHTYYIFLILDFLGINQWSMFPPMSFHGGTTSRRDDIVQVLCRWDK